MLREDFLDVARVIRPDELLPCTPEGELGGQRTVDEVGDGRLDHLGVASPAGLREIVEASDCVLLLGEQISDTSLGVSANRLSEKNLLIATARDVYIGHHRYQHTPLDGLVERLASDSALPSLRFTPPAQVSSEVARSQDTAPIAVLVYDLVVLVLPMVWIGDTPAINITDFDIPGIGTFTVRLFFDKDRYAGIWANPKVGGHMFGKIEKQQN